MASSGDRPPAESRADVPREGAWGAAGVGLLLGLFILAVIATAHSLLTTLG